MITDMNLLNGIKNYLAPILEKSIELSGFKRKAFFGEVIKYLKGRNEDSLYDGKILN